MMKQDGHARGRRLAALAMAGFAALAVQTAAAQAPPLHGIIVARDGPNMTINLQGGGQTVVTLSEHTKVTASKGMLGLRSQDLLVSDLLPGLPVDVHTTQAGTQTLATEVRFAADDLKTARQVEAGTAELQASNQELRHRLSEANQYVEKGEATVLFAVGSAKISPEGQQALKALATKAHGVKGYLIGVVGYADPTGDTEANERLSQKRADAVIRYLQQHCGVQPYRVMASDAMGETHLVGDTSTHHGLAQNRRVVVKILTNKGLEGL